MRKENKVLNNTCKAKNLLIRYVISNFRFVFKALLDITILKAIKKCMVLRNYNRENKLCSPPELAILRHPVYHSSSHAKS